MLYPITTLIAIDQATGARVENGTGNVYAVSDTARTTPLNVFDLSGLPLTSNLLTTNSEALVPPFQVEDEWQVVFVSGDSEIILTSYLGLKEEAAASADAANTVVTRAENGEFKGSPGDSAYQVWLSLGNTGTVEDYLAAIEGPQGQPGSNVLPTDQAIRDAVAAPTSLTRGALDAEYVGKGELTLNVADLGASPTATETVNRAALQAAIDKSTTFGIEIYTPPGQYATNGPLFIDSSPVAMVAGPMGAAEIRSSVGNVLEFTASNIGSRFEGMYFVALNGAGHVIKVNDGVSVVRAKFDHCHMWQVGTGNIISITGTGAMYDSTFDTCHLRRRTVAGMGAGVHVSVAGTYFNSNMFINVRCEDTAHGSTAPFWDLASTGASQYLSGNKWVGLDMAKVDGGSFKGANLRGNTFDTVVGYDNGTVTAHTFDLTGSAHNTFINCDRRGGTLAAGIYDINLTASCESTTVIGVGAGNNISYNFGDSTVSVVGDTPRATMIGTARTTQVSGGQVKVAGAPIMSGAGEPEGTASGPVGSVYLRKGGAATGMLYYKESGTGTTGWRSSSQTPAQPGANLASVTHPINTASKAAGRSAFDTTANRPVWAIGGAASSPWVFADGTTAHSPA